jgi:hypothetical protein
MCLVIEVGESALEWMVDAHYRPGLLGSKWLTTYFKSLSLIILKFENLTFSKRQPSRYIWVYLARYCVLGPLPSRDRRYDD